MEGEGPTKRRLVIPQKSKGLRTFDEPPLQIHTDQSLLCEDTGGDVWMGGYALGRLILQNRDLVRGRSVLELGSGTGLAGLSAAIAGASHVTLTDKDSQTALLHKNLQANHDAVVLRGGPRAGEVPVDVVALDWSECRGWARLQQRSYSVVLCADLLYDEDACESLLALFEGAISPILARSGGGANGAAERERSVLVAQSHRNDRIEAAFMTRMEQRGYQIASMAAESQDDLWRSGIGVWRLFYSPQHG